MGFVRMAKKQKPVINITGSNQAATVQSLYAAKKSADGAKRFFDSCKESFLQMITPKIYKFWGQNMSVVTGGFDLNVVDSEMQSITVQNRQSSVSFTANEATEVLSKLNEGIDEGKKLKYGDVFTVETSKFINPIAMNPGKSKERILSALVNLESELKADGIIPPEMSLVMEHKAIKLTEVAIPRLLSVSNDFQGAMDIIGNPIVINVVVRKEDAN
jgi:hypothetical protein